ncbi:hypothetical protein AB4391_10570 [Vibrio lentus]|nr:hypothetical protein [Vibrio cyclitrophicus]
MANKNQDVILDILVGNEWRHIHLTHQRAIAFIRRANHRGYLITPMSEITPKTTSRTRRR